MSPSKDKKKAPTIIDIAREAGVSKSLVSLALANRPGVSEEKRARILQTAETLGYRRNSWAQSLVRGSSELIGVVITDSGSDYNNEVVVGVEDQAIEAGYTTVMAHGRRNAEVISARVRTMVELGVDGLVIVSSRTPQEVVIEVANKVPVVIVGRPDSTPDNVDIIRNDDELGAQLATEHLISHGHKNLGLIATSTRTSIVARTKAFNNTLTQHGLDYRWGVHRGEESRDEFCRRIVETYRNSEIKPTALFVTADSTAIRLLAAFADQGVSIPHDLAIASYNDSTFASLSRPGLTSVHQPSEFMGNLAMKLLKERIDGREERVVKIMKPSLSIRESSGGASLAD